MENILLLTESQKKSVNEIFKLYKSGQRNCSFKAPTGSGKTFMSSAFISKVFQDTYLSGEKTIIIVATVSNAELPKAFARKLETYKKFHDFNNYEIEFIHSPSSTKGNSKKIEDIKEFDIKENKVYVFGISSFGKNTHFYKNKTLNNFYVSCKNMGYNVVFIRDEAHIGKKEKIGVKELKNFDQITKENSNFVIEMTATPKSRHNLVELTPEEMEEDGVQLLKKEMIKSNMNGEISNEEIIDEAIKTFKNSKIEYSKIKGTIIKPAMIVQVMNESDYEVDPIKNEEFVKGLELLERKLSDAGLIYLKYLDKKEVIGSTLENSLEYASKNDSAIDVIIIKVGPATGWDIPRANTILQLRNVSSESLNIQTLGRIMRNPIPNLPPTKSTNKYYVYSNYQKPTRNAAIYQLKDKFDDKLMFKGYINKESRIIEENNQRYIDEVNEYLFSNKFLHLIRDWNEDEIIYDKIEYGTSRVVNRIPNFVKLNIYNTQKHMEKNNELYYSSFYDSLKEISEKEKVDLEIVKYYFYNKSNKFSEIKAKTSDWFHSDDPYEISKDSKLLKNYQIWVDNVNPKQIDVSDILNYGYYQITREENIQFLDSTPEYKFCKKLLSTISKNQRDKMSFFAKMPTLGSDVYFEYFSKISGKISKSFMDFAIEYNGKIIMIEVKSKDKDYSVEKTKELLTAYEKYMVKFSSENINLVLHQYDGDSESHYLNFYKNGEWKEEASFRDAFDFLLN